MSTGRSGERRAAVGAALLLLVAAAVRVLTLDLASGRRALVAVAAGGALAWVIAAALLRRRQPPGALHVLASGVLPAGLLAAVIYGSEGHFGAVAPVVVLLFVAILVSIPARAATVAQLVTTAAVDGLVVVAWLLWAGTDLLALLVALAAASGLQLAAAARGLSASDALGSDGMRRAAHASTAERVGTAIDVLGVTRAVLENVRDIFPVTSEAAILLYDAAGNRLRPLPLYLGPAGVSPLEADNLDLAIAPGEGLAGRVFAGSRPMVWPTAFDIEMAQANLSEQTRVQLLSLRRGVLRSAIGAPLVIDDEVTGAYLLVTRRQELAWSEDDFTVVTALAAEAARAIERARRYERDLDQAHLDSITGLASHRQLTRTLDQEVARARRLQASLGVLFCDLDRFKAVNDTYGHAAGDRVLTILARVFHESLRREDSAARYGGDEFVCVLPGADRAEADAVGRRVADGFATRVAEDPEMRTAGVTISCGVAIFPDDGDGVESLLGSADSAMRVVKARHRGSSPSSR